MNGRTFPSFTSTGGVGAIGSNTPGPGVGWTYGTTSSKWSPVRHATMPAAAAAPTALPPTFAGPSGIVAMNASYLPCTVAVWAGTRATSTSRAA